MVLHTYTLATPSKDAFTNAFPLSEHYVLHLGYIDFAMSSCGRGIDRGMSYNLTVQCGCVVYVSCDPKTGLAHARVIERKGDQCRVRTHDVGVRLYLWELLPEPVTPPTIRFDTA